MIICTGNIGCYGQNWTEAGFRNRLYKRFESESLYSFLLSYTIEYDVGVLMFVWNCLLFLHLNDENIIILSYLFKIN